MKSSLVPKRTVIESGQISSAQDEGTEETRGPRGVVGLCQSKEAGAQLPRHQMWCRAGAVVDHAVGEHRINGVP